MNNVLVFAAPVYVICRGLYDITFGPAKGLQTYDYVIAVALLVVGAVIGG